MGGSLKSPALSAGGWWCAGGGWFGAKAPRRQQLTGGVCPCLCLTFEPLQFSEETGSEERCLYSQWIKFQMAPLPKLNKYTIGFLCSKKCLTAHAQRSKCDISTLCFFMLLPYKNPKYVKRHIVLIHCLFLMTLEIDSDV